MKERRRYERFPLKLTARMEMITNDKKRVFDFETRDISASGAFIYNNEFFPEGTRFKLNLTVPSQTVKELTGAKSLIESEGNVVRTTQKGMAIHFDKKCQIMSLQGM